MSCRQWLSSALRQCQSGLARQQQQQSRAISTSAPVAQFHSVFGNNMIDDEGPTRNPRRAPRSDPNESLQGLLTEGFERGGPLTPEEQRQVLRQQHGTAYHIKDLRSTMVTDNYTRQMPRRWKSGDVYAPRDLTPVEMRKWRQGKRPDRDVVDIYGFNPLDNYRNFSLISEFVTHMGRIRHSSETGLRPVNQRKMAKAVRRAIGMGLHPSVHRHPEIMRASRHGMPTAAIPTPADPSQNRL